MWLKKRSLRFKLTGFYIISVLIVVVGIITYIEYNNYRSKMWETLDRAEVGPGFINGTQPDIVSFLEAVNNNSTYALKASDINNRLERFEPFIDKAMEGGVRWGSSVDGPITIEGQDYYNVTWKTPRTLSGEQFVFGPVTLPKSFFPNTIAAYENYYHDRRNALYYIPIAGHPKMIFVVSLDSNIFPDAWQQRLISDLIIGSPLIIIFAVVFGLLISWLTAGPLRRITEATEMLSHSTLNQRVEINSDDEIGRLAQAFNTMADRVEESFNAQKRFVSDAAHELRTPLASMKTSVTRALSKGGRSADDQKLLDFLSGRIDYMEAMVNDLLFLSRVDEGKLKQDDTRLDLSEVLKEAEESFQYLFEDKGIEFSSEIEPGLIIKGDRKLMLRVISNLLDNAVKNTPSGGNVSLIAGFKNEKIVVTVSNTGHGIPAEHIPHLFDRFYKVPGLSDSGYGLGLAIIKSIITSIGGNISVQSEPDSGSIFSIELPGYTKTMPAE
jgi:two-component system heavy metal sensor histidine kinase CusS